MSLITWLRDKTLGKIRLTTQYFAGCASVLLLISSFSMLPILSSIGSAISLGVFAITIGAMITQRKKPSLLGMLGLSAMAIGTTALSLPLLAHLIPFFSYIRPVGFMVLSLFAILFSVSNKTNALSKPLIFLGSTFFVAHLLRLVATLTSLSVLTPISYALMGLGIFLMIVNIKAPINPLHKPSKNSSSDSKNFAQNGIEKLIAESMTPNNNLSEGQDAHNNMTANV